MAETITVTLPGELVAEVEPLLHESNLDLSTFVAQAVQAYATATAQLRLQEQLAQDYDELAAMYDELADELADEIWLGPETMVKVDQALALHLDLPIAPLSP